MFSGSVSVPGRRCASLKEVDDAHPKLESGTQLTKRSYTELFTGSATLKTDMQKMELCLTLRLGSVIVVTMGVFATLVAFLS